MIKKPTVTAVQQLLPEKPNAEEEKDVDVITFKEVEVYVPISLAPFPAPVIPSTLYGHLIPSQVPSPVSPFP